MSPRGVNFDGAPIGMASYDHRCTLLGDGTYAIMWRIGRLEHWYQVDEDEARAFCRKWSTRFPGGDNDNG